MQNTTKQFEITRVGDVTAEHWQLLLRADPSQNMIQKYLQAGKTFEIRRDDQLVAIMVLQDTTPATLEIKNIATAPEFENRGFATQLLQFAISYAKERDYPELQIGTGSTSFKQLYLYQKMGFRITDVKRDFFVNNYDQPIHEGGLLLQDMVVLTCDLT